MWTLMMGGSKNVENFDDILYECRLSRVAFIFVTLKA